MNISISIHDFNTICRVCLQKNENTLIFMTTEIINMIESCTSVQENFNNCKIPQQMCSNCHAQLQKAYEFRQQYLESTKILTEMILKTEVHPYYEIKEENEVKIENDNFENDTGNDEFEISEKELDEEKSNVNFDDVKTQLTGDTERILNENNEKVDVKLDKRREQKKVARKTNTSASNDIACDICGRKFKKRKYVNVHKKVHSNVRPFECNVCGKLYKYKDGLTMHMSEKHDSGPKRRKVCFICGKLIIPGAFQAHMSIHQRSETDKKFKCDICERVYLQESTLEQHIQDKHCDTVKKQFNCDICNKSYPTNVSLKTHKTYTHSDEKKFKCKFCDKSYKMLSPLNAHILAAHKDFRPHTCSTCNKAFHTSTLLKQHMICHTGERPHSCEICGKSFGQKSVLTTHKKVHSK